MTLADLSRIDPTIAASADDYVMLLRQVRTVSSLSYWEIEQRAADLGIMLEPASLVEALSGPDLPPEEMVVGLLRACGFTDDQLDRWLWVYDSLARPIEPAPPVLVVAPQRHRRRLLVILATAVAVVTIAAVALREGPKTLPAAPIPGPASGGLVEGAGGASAVPSAAPIQPSPSPSAAPSQPQQESRPTASPPSVPSPVPSAVLATHQGLDLDAGRLSDGPALISEEYDVVAVSGGMRAGDTQKRLSKGCTEKPDRSVTDLAVGSTLCVFSTKGTWYRLTITAVRGNGYTFTYGVLQQ